MSAQANRETAANRANDLITQVRGAKEVSASARQEIAELAQQASEAGVSNEFVEPVVEALKQTNKAVCATVLSVKRTTYGFGKTAGTSATMTYLGHMLYQLHVKENPFSFGDRKPRADKPTAEEKAWLRENRGKHWWSSDNGQTTDKVLKAKNIADARKALAGAPAPEPMAEAPAIDTSALSREQLEDLLNGILNG